MTEVASAECQADHATAWSTPSVSSLELDQLRVILYTPVFSPSMGGMETYAAGLGAGLVEMGARVILVTDTAGERESRQFPFPVVRRPGRRQQLALVRWAHVVQLSGFDLPLFLLAKALRKPIVWTRHAYGPTECATLPPAGQRARCGPLHLSVCWPILRSHSTTLGGAVKAYLRQWAHIFARHFVEANIVSVECHRQDLDLPDALIIPHWADVPNQWEPAPRPGVPTIVFVSRHIRGKGGDVLLRALGRLLPQSAEWHVVLAGEGPERLAWMDLAHQLGVPAAFPGALSKDAVAELFRSADVVVVPSELLEYVGLTALEAMAEGAYVIASAIAGLGAVVQQCGGATFPAGDDAALAALLSATLSDRDHTQHLGQRARDRVMHGFSKGQSIRAYAVLYRSLLATSQREWNQSPVPVLE